jgi:ring-1,2-phenylacetyl-CoA epoxidase subunit PaaE
MLKFHALRVREVRQESEDAIRLVLDVPADLAADYRAAAGQHVVLRSRVGTDEARRTYSITGPAGELPLTLGVRVHPHGQFSRHLARNVHAGDALDVMPPNGSFGAALATAQAPTAETATGAATYVAFASGCGITPVLSIVRTLLETVPAARVQLFYGNRHTARAMFLEDLLALKDRFPARLALHFVMSAEPQDADVYNGRIDAAKVARLAQGLFDPRAVRAFFICGPGTMIGDVTGALHSLGVEPQRIHAEHFTVETSAATPTRAESAAKPRVAAAGMADVSVLMDGRRRTFTMRMGGETLLDAAATAGIDLPYSCRAGVCSTCRTRLARGQVEMEQNFALEDWELERGFILACQAHPTTAEIELDYDER